MLWKDWNEPSKQDQWGAVREGREINTFSTLLIQEVYHWFQWGQNQRKDDIKKTSDSIQSFFSLQSALNLINYFFFLN